MKNLWAVVFFLIISICPAGSTYATPPQDLEVKYDIGTQILNVKMRHITIELRDHYIRTIRVTVNEGEPQVFRYPFQKKPAEFEVDIPIVLNPGDKVVVKAECKLGGSAETEIFIPRSADEVPEEEILLEVPPKGADGSYPEQDGN